VLVTCFSLLAGAAAGCSTTQEKAEKQQARATHILEARAERQKQKRKDKEHGRSSQKQGRAEGSDR
jgi:mannose/cellobiose epimerase-like protein (N-acyl-D-glucosamine 2-epimerase family)